MKLPKIIPVLLVLIIMACGPLTINTPTFTPSNSLTDLIVSNVYLGMQGIAGGWINCVPGYGPYEIRAIVQNLGETPVYNIPVVELSTGIELQIGELGALQSMELYFPAMSTSGTYSVSVDPRNTIPESNENNNTFSYLAITPTPPALCPPVESPTPTMVPTIVSGNPTLSLTVLYNGVYRSPDWGEFQLTDGVYYRPLPTSQESPEAYTTRIQEPIFYGDINADGLEDALVILNTQNGGTGHFIELAAVLNQNGSTYNVSTVYLGDRVVIESGKVEGGTVSLSMRVQGPNDGMCCPSQSAAWGFVLNGNQLVKLP